MPGPNRVSKQPAERIPDQCHPNPLNWLIRSGADYVISVGEQDVMKVIPREEARIISEVKKAHNIDERSCTAAVLDALWIGISPGKEREMMFYSNIYDKEGVKRWTKREINKSLKELEAIGVLHMTTLRNLGRQEVAYWKKIAHAFGLEESRFLDQEIVMINLRIPDSAFGAPKPGDPVLVTNFRSMNEGETPKLEAEEGVIEQLDLRALRPDEKAHRIDQFMKKPFLDAMPALGSKKTTRKERIATAKVAVALAPQLPHISSMHLAGSVARKTDNEWSDTDVAVVRDRCPGYKDCGAIIQKKSGVDIFCFTGEEFKAAEEVGLALLSDARRIYQRPA